MAMSIKLDVIQIRIFTFAVHLLTTGCHDVLWAVPLMNRHLSEFCPCRETNTDTLVEAVGQSFCHFNSVCQILDGIKQRKSLAKCLENLKANLKVIYEHI